MVSFSDYAVITNDTIYLYEEKLLTHAISLAMIQKNKTKFGKWEIERLPNNTFRIWFEFTIIRPIEKEGRVGTTVSFDRYSIEESWFILVFPALPFLILLGSVFIFGATSTQTVGFCSIFIAFVYMAVSAYPRLKFV